VTEWFYKTTPTKAGFDDTRRLAKRDGFVCRSAHEKNEAWVESVQAPVIGDTLHFYFVEQRRSPRPIGSFEIIAAEAHAEPSRFGEQVDTTALFRVKDPGFASQLRAFGDYQPDPVVKDFTGWLLKPLASLPPAFEQTPLKGSRSSLHKRES
jgi:hypothetical protein